MCHSHLSPPAGVTQTTTQTPACVYFPSYADCINSMVHIAKYIMS